MEIVKLDKFDNIKYFPNIVLRSPLEYINAADENKILKLEFPEFDVEIKYKCDGVECIETEYNGLSEHMKQYIKDQHDYVVSLNINRSEENKLSETVSGVGIGSYCEIKYKFPQCVVWILQYTNDQIQEELKRLHDMVK